MTENGSMDRLPEYIMPSPSTVGIMSQLNMQKSRRVQEEYLWEGAMPPPNGHTPIVGKN